MILITCMKWIKDFTKPRVTFKIIVVMEGFNLEKVEKCSFFSQIETFQKNKIYFYISALTLSTIHRGIVTSLQKRGLLL